MSLGVANLPDRMTKNTAHKQSECSLFKICGDNELTSSTASYTRQKFYDDKVVARISRLTAIKHGCDA